MTPNPTIFVQIAAYRDPQLIPTLQDMLARARYPENLRVGICRQYHPGDTFDDLRDYQNDPRFRIWDVLYTRAKGVCWARNIVQRMYQDETYTLQLDSHMRFVDDWDILLIEMLQNLQAAGHPKPLITAYVPSFDPENDPAARVNVPWLMNFDRFIPEGAIFFLPAVIPGWEERQLPVPARFYSAHMAFSLGAFSREVQHNPDYYFHGEEISIAVRAFTHGYDLFHPHRVLIWHEYTRKGRTKQWDDDKAWTDRNRSSHLTNRKLFGMDGEAQTGHDGPYGFGPKRTLQEYEEYAGIIFANRLVQKYTLDDQIAPNPGPETFPNREAYLASFSSVYKHCIDLHRGAFPEDDYEYWVVAFHGEDGKTINRRDADADEIQQILSAEGDQLAVWREFMTLELPAYWVVWPYSTAKGWCAKITAPLK